jgi:hypothetical protein
MNISFLKTLLSIAITLSTPLTLRADNVVFHILTSSVTVTTNGSTSRLGGPGCGFVFMQPDVCLILLTPPSAGTNPDDNLHLFVAYSEPGDPTTIADSLQVGAGSLPFPPFIPFYQINFSAAGPAGGGPCGTACIGPVTGLLQTAFTLDWFNAAGAIVSSDTVSFESGTGVPEPSSIPWLLTALAILGVAIRQRKSAA